MLISLTYWSLLKDHVVLSFLFIFYLLVAAYLSCLQDCGMVRFILLHPTIFAKNPKTQKPPNPQTLKP